jgi:hypothetical protein
VRVKILLYEVQRPPSSPKVYKEKVNTTVELVACIMNSAAFLKQEHQDDLRRATLTVVKRVKMCVEVRCGIFKHLLWTFAIYGEHLHNQHMQPINHLPFLHTLFKAFMCNIQTTVSPHPSRIRHKLIWTYILGIDHTTTS